MKFKRNKVRKKLSSLIDNFYELIIVYIIIKLKEY